MGNVCSRMCPPSSRQGRRDTDTTMKPSGTFHQGLDPPVEQSPQGSYSPVAPPHGLGMSGGTNYGITVGINKGIINAGDSQIKSIPGTLSAETLKLLINDAKETFVPTESFNQVQKKLDQAGHVTICGAPGEGKTTMALMLARDYQEKDYDVWFVEGADTFDFNLCISSTHKVLLIFDDIFGSIGLSTEVTQLKRLFLSLTSHIQDLAKRTMKGSGKGKQKSNENQRQGEGGGYKEIRVVFTSKTYNFREAILFFEHERLSLFKEDTVVDATTNKNHCYTKEEKVAIFEQYKNNHKTNHGIITIQDLPKEFLWEQDDMLFGFPLTCRLYFDCHHLVKSPEDFFKHPLMYLKRELLYLLKLNNNQTAALILMILCEDKLDLPKLELEGNDQKMDQLFEHVKEIVSNSTRSGIATSARTFSGTYFSETDILRFTHSSVYDACASALYQINKSYVFKYCSYDFLYERVKPASETREAEYLGFIYLEFPYYDMFATKLARGMTEGYFANTVTHPTLQDEQFVEILLTKIKVESDPDQITDMSWVHQKDKGKGLLYWAVLGPISLIVHKIDNEIKIEFEVDEVIEALDGCVEKDDKALLELLSSKLHQEFDSKLKNRLLQLSAKTGSSTSAEYLIAEGADINATNDDMENYLHIACQVGTSKMLRVLKDLITDCSQQIEVNATDTNGRTPIMIAALSGSFEYFQLFMINSNIDIRDNYGDSPFHLACQGGESDIVQHLLTSSNINSKGRHGWTPLMMAAVKGHKHLFDLLLSKNADLMISTDSGDCLLHLVCQGGNQNMVEHVLQFHDIDTKGENGWTPLMVSAVEGHLHVFKFLADKGADWQPKDNDGDSLLHLACQGGNIEIVQEVLNRERPNIDMQGENSWTPIMVAAVEGHLSVFNFLVSQNADLTLADEDDDSLIHLACQGGNIEIVKLVVKRIAPDINQMGANSWTPVMVAAKEGNLSVFRFLISQNADLTLVDVDGDSLIHMACQGGNREIVKFLIQKNPSDIDSLGEHGWTPIMVAAAEGHQSVFEFLHSNDADLRLLDKGGSGLLHIACQGGNRSIVKELLTCSNINMKGMAGRTPIMIAAASGHKTLFEFLISNNADLELVDSNGNTLLHHACQGGNKDIVQRFLTPSNVNSRNRHDLTPAMRAAHYGHRGIIDLLMQNHADLFLVDHNGYNAVDHAQCEEMAKYLHSVIPYMHSVV